MTATVVVLSRFPDLFDRFRNDLDHYEPTVQKILVRDGKEIDFHSTGTWFVVEGVQPFNFSRNMNRGWRLAGRSDVVIAGDDVRFTSPFIKKLQEVAYSDPKIGFAVPELGGQSCFVCAYIKRQLIDEVGEMDEKFDGYGMEDNDYYRRFEALGWRTQPTTEVTVLHSGGTSFYRREGEGGLNVQVSSEQMRQKYNNKWGVL